jgi:hypothetical protein
LINGGGGMTKEEKVGKACLDFSSLGEEQQEYILGILQALVFAKNEIMEQAPSELATQSQE